MADSIAEQICARIATVLTGTTAAGAAVYRDRQDAFAREETPAILIEAADENADPLGTSPAVGPAAVERNELLVTVAVCVRSATWQQAADAVRVQAHALLLADATLRLLAPGIRRTRCQWAAANADVPFGHAAQTYAFTYLTRAGDITSAP